MKRRKQGSLEEKSQIGDSTAHVNVYWNVSQGSSLKNQPAGCPKANHNMVKSILKSHYLTKRKFNAKVLQPVQVFLATGKILDTFQNNPAFIAGFPCLFPFYLCSALQSQKKIYEKRKNWRTLFSKVQKYRNHNIHCAKWALGFIVHFQMMFSICSGFWTSAGGCSSFVRLK